MKKELVIQKLREHGYKITPQRLLLLDIILEEQCTSCKEIYYEARRRDGRIGSATVYRFIGILGDLNIIEDRSKLVFKLSDGES